MRTNASNSEFVKKSYLLDTAVDVMKIASDAQSIGGARTHPQRWPSIAGLRHQCLCCDCNDYCYYWRYYDLYYWHHNLYYCCCHVWWELLKNLEFRDWDELTGGRVGAESGLVRTGQDWSGAKLGHKSIKAMKMSFCHK